MTRPARIVVGEGRTAQQGLLRFVLEGEGFEVVGEARATADLAGVIEANRPDVVVLDDGIGVMAVSMVHEVAPQAKVVLVWPSAVVPIGGDARVEPAKILRDLGPAVTHVLAPAAALSETFERPGWIDKVRKDPAALREKLGSGQEAAKRPSVTRLQRRGKRLHPIGRRSDRASGEHRTEDIPAPVVVLPVGNGGTDLEPVLDIGGGTPDFVPTDEPADERSDWNRRLGTLALSGAAAVSALVLALALGGGRVGVSVVRGGGGQLPVGVPGFFAQGGQVGQGPFGSLGAGGYDPSVSDDLSGPGDQDGGGAGVEGDEGLGGDLATPGGSDGSDEPTPGEDPGSDDGTGGDGGGNDGGGDGGGGNGGGGNGGGNGGGGSEPDDGLPGHSADHNPHGGPPGQMGITPAHGPGLGASVASQHHHKH